MKYKIQIGSIFNIEESRVEPKTVIEISEDQKMLIDQFAWTRKDENLNTIYRINDCEFTMVPVLEINELVQEKTVLENFEYAKYSIFHPFNIFAVAPDPNTAQNAKNYKVVLDGLSKIEAEEIYDHIKQSIIQLQP